MPTSLTCCLHASKPHPDSREDDIKVYTENIHTYIQFSQTLYLLYRNDLATTT